MAWDQSGPNPNAPQISSRDGSPLPLVTQGLSVAAPTLTLNARQVVNHVNGNKGKVATVTSRVGSRKQIISWMDAPDDLYFCSTELSK